MVLQRLRAPLTEGSGGGGGGTPPPQPGFSITLNPSNPGSRAAGIWNTVATYTGVTNFHWVVQNGADYNWTWETQPVTGPVPGNGQVNIAAPFTRTGQFVSCLDADNITDQRQTISLPVTII